MMPHHCPHEPVVARAADRASLPEEIRLHAETCDACRQVLRLREGLRTLAAESRPPHRLPSAEEIWWKAEVIRRLTAPQEADALAARPAVWGQVGGLVAAVAVLLFFFGSWVLESLAGLSGDAPSAILLVLAGVGMAFVAALMSLELLREA